MRTYLIKKEGKIVQFVARQSEAKMMSKAISGSFETMDVPIDKSGLIHFLNSMVPECHESVQVLTNRFNYSDPIIDEDNKERNAYYMSKGAWDYYYPDGGDHYSHAQAYFERNYNVKK